MTNSRYDRMTYRRCGRSGLLLPAVSLGAWETFGGYRDSDIARQVMLRAFDLGVTHFDFANNYGNPPGNAEVVCGRVLAELPRDEIVISSKAGYRMWPGPYGEWGSRKHLIASCDQSLARMGLEYFDIFYSHRPDPDTPMEETLGALDSLVRRGKALYIGVSSYTGDQYAEAVRICQREGFARILIHQPYYNLLGRTIEHDLLPVIGDAGVIAFCPLGSGLLTGRYLDGEVPADSRAAREWASGYVRSTTPAQRAVTLQGLANLAKERGQTLAQLAIAWILRRPTLTSALIGASTVEQLEENVRALDHLELTPDELTRIDELTTAATG
jgi:L-glyceraldehyde 3-phosphate reductase